MSLKSFHHGEPGGPIDVRSLSLPPEKETIPYPIPAFVQEKEFAIPPENLQEYVQYCEDCFNNDQHDMRHWEQTFCLKILLPKVIPTPRMLSGNNKYKLNSAAHIFDLGRERYVFSGNPQEFLAVINSSSEEILAICDKHAAIDHVNEALLELFFSAYLLDPQYFTPAVLEPYWPKFFAAFQGGRRFPPRGLQAAAYLRVLYPEHLAELEITLEKLKAWEAGLEDYDNEWERVAYLEILTRPEIPGLTTWPPKKIGEEPRLGDNTLEQPQTLNL